MEYLSGDYAHFRVDDLLDFPKEDETMADSFFGSLPGNSGDSSTVTAVESCNSSVSGGGDGQFNGNVSIRSFNETRFPGNELCVPYDELAELEWLSNFVEESFSTDDLHIIPPAAVGATVPTDTSSAITTHSPPRPQFLPADVSVPGKARSKRSRAAPCDWSSRLLVLSPKTAVPTKKRDPTETSGRRCLHCASEKTPQWRAGPMGPKTLCNACGVRYKSGRLVPEYRPAASPTFISNKHSNSHRKVLELRRQKELQVQRAHLQPLIVGGHQMFNGCDEFLIHHRSTIDGPDFSHMI